MAELKTPPTYDSRSPREWLEMADSGEVALPTFQRSRVWTPMQTAEYIRALLERRPTGTFLILAAAATPQFRYRWLHGVKPDPTTAPKVKELVLDGQQRLTSLWRALVGADKRYFIRVEDLKARKLRVREVTWRSRRWSNPTKMYSGNWVPVDILWYDRPSLVKSSKSPSDSNAMKAWTVAAVGKEKWDSLYTTVLTIRERLLKDPKLHFCRLDKDTDRDTAIDIFINVNKSVTKLKPIDIAVAMAEERHQEDLRKRAEEYLARSTEAKHYFNRSGQKEIPEIAEWMLKVGCLKVRGDRRPGLPPKESHYPSAVDWLYGSRTGEDAAARAARLRCFEDDIDRALRFAAWRGGATKRTLPSKPPVYVVAALQDDVREAVATCPECREDVDRLLSAYMWRSFVTSRYQTQGNDRLLEDYRALRRYINSQVKWTSVGDDRPKLEVPAFDEKAHKVPRENNLVRAGWIGGSRLGRAIAAVVMQEPPYDWLTGKPLDVKHIRELEQGGRLERRHVFPLSTFDEIPDKKIKCGLNGVLLAKGSPPLKVADPADLLANVRKHHQPGIGSLELRERLGSHCINGHDLSRDVGVPDYRYQRFLKARAKTVANRIAKLVAY